MECTRFGSRSEVVCLAASPIGSRLACFFDNSAVHDDEINAVIFDFQHNSSVEFEAICGTDACFDGEGKRLAFAEWNSIVIVDANTAEKVLEIDCTIGRDARKTHVRMDTFFQRHLGNSIKLLDDYRRHNGEYFICS